MTISDYLKDALMQIDKGVRAAKTEKEGYGFALKKNGTIKFDLAVINRKDKKGKIKLEVLAFGSKGEASVSDELTSRVKFEIEYQPNAGK